MIFAQFSNHTSIHRPTVYCSPTEQLASFLHEARESGVFEMYYIELATGLRRGELLGLKWEDIDLERGTIQVRRQIARINGEVVEAPLKTKNSYRSVSIGHDAVEILKPLNSLL